MAQAWARASAVTVPGVLLCKWCHASVHRGLLVIEGNPLTGLTFTTRADRLNLALEAEKDELVEISRIGVPAAGPPKCPERAEGPAQPKPPDREEKPATPAGAEGETAGEAVRERRREATPEFQSAGPNGEHRGTPEFQSASPSSEAEPPPKSERRTSRRSAGEASYGVR